MGEALENGVQTDPKVALPEIANLANARVDILQIRMWNWYVEYNSQQQGL